MADKTPSPLGAQGQEKETTGMSREPSPSTSTRTHVDDDVQDGLPLGHEHRHQIASGATRSEKSHQVSRESGDGYETEDTDHGEPDIEHQEAEESVPGRELDRQLSRVCSTDRVSLGDLMNDGADKPMWLFPQGP